MMQKMMDSIRSEFYFFLRWDDNIPQLGSAGSCSSAAVLECVGCDGSGGDGHIGTAATGRAPAVHPLYYKRNIILELDNFKSNNKAYKIRG
jgi:hypothetical protein